MVTNLLVFGLVLLSLFQNGLVVLDGGSSCLGSGICLSLRDSLIAGDLLLLQFRCGHFSAVAFQYEKAPNPVMRRSSPIQLPKHPHIYIQTHTHNTHAPSHSPTYTNTHTDHNTTSRKKKDMLCVRPAMGVVVFVVSQTSPSIARVCTSQPFQK